VLLRAEGADLTLAETNLLCAIAGGYSAAEVAATFGVERGTVKNQLHGVLAKTGASSALDLRCEIYGSALGIPGTMTSEG
jgi:DNA-binding CsgD family transcriptional regulator